MLLALCACAPAKEPIGKPKLVILGPVDGARFKVGEPIGATFSAVGRGKLLKIVVTINGAEEQSRQIDPPDTVATIGMSLNTRSTGKLILSAAAIDAGGERSEAAIVSIFVGDEQASTETSGVSGANNAAGNGTTAAVDGVPQPSASIPGCALGAQYLSDISIPDGTQIQAGANFVKTWRMRNTSTCNWPAGFRLAFFEDEPMSKAAVSDPLGPITQNQDFDVSVALTAPQVKGVYTSTWRLRDTSGTSFGNRVYVSVRVP